MNTETKGKAIVEFEKIIDEIHQKAIDIGFINGNESGIKKGYADAREELEIDRNIEKICTEYCTDQFTDCKTLCDFQDKLKEITLRSYNFM